MDIRDECLDIPLRNKNLICSVLISRYSAVKFKILYYAKVNILDITVE